MMRRPPALVAGVALAALVTAASLVATPGPAYAESRVSIDRTSGLAADGPTTLRLRGSGFQSIQGGFGGLYVFFGWVSGSWRPSQGGVTGEDYQYVPDSESRQNAGHQRFVAFPGSDTEGSANGGVIAADGTWSTDLVVPGARFEAADRTGGTTTVDCLEVTCGVITLGAHGVVNDRNETFTAVSFTTGPSASESAAPSTSAAPSASAAPSSAGSAAPSTSAGALPAPSGKPRLTIDRASAVQGRVLSFIGSGFAPGEQVLASLDDGVASVGPLTAGQRGEVAGVLQLPAEVGAGTHALRLSGAGSGVRVTVNFPVRLAAAASDPDEAAAAPAEAADAGPSAASVAFVAAAATALLAVLLVCGWLLLRRRGGRAATHEVSHVARPPAAENPGASEATPRPTGSRDRHQGPLPDPRQRTTPGPRPGALARHLERR